MKAKKRIRNNYSAENQPYAWLFLAPALSVILVFNVYPILRSVWLSFQKGSLLRHEFTGLSNYRFVLNDPIFHTAIKNTSIYAFFVVPISLLISLLIAWLIYEKIKNKGFFETIFFIPYVTSTIAIGIVFKYLLNSRYGFLNYILSWFGIDPINWLGGIEMSIPSIIIFGVWSGLAFNIIILLAGFRNIPKDYYKVADLFGASNWEKFKRITFPQLLPTITFLLTVNLIGAFKVYSQVYALFGGQPGIANSAQTAVFYIYDKFHIAQRPGIAMAATMVLFMMILIVTLIQNWIVKKGEH